MTETITKQTAYDQLAEIGTECGTANWDRDGAEPVKAETLQIARRFIDALPCDGPVPDVCAEPDGHVDLEWYRATNRLLSLSVGPEGMLYYAALVDDEDPRGACRFEGEIPEALLHWIGRVCAAHEGVS